MQKEIFDCHCHFTNLDDFLLYKKTSPATKFLNIRSINHPVLVEPYKFKTFENIENMYLTESVNLELLEELIRIEKNIKQNSKIVAIKVYLGYQSYFANDNKIKKVAELASKYNISVIFHCGECYSTGEEVTYSDALYVAELSETYPNINFIASHLNWPKFDNVFNLCEKYPNVFTCISGCLDATDKTKRQNQVQKVIELLNEYLKKYPNLKNKLMYGTDFFKDDKGFTDVSDYQDIVKSLDLTEKEKNCIFSKNMYKAYPKL